MTDHAGSCLCGGVAFEVDGPLRPPDACHCSTCRKQSGHHWASTNVDRARFRLIADRTLRWYAASDKVRRGFCGTCGCFLFWDPIEHPVIAIGMGAFDGPTGTHLEKHIFVSEQGDYYTLDDGLPRSPRF